MCKRKLAYSPGDQGHSKGANTGGGDQTCCQQQLPSKKGKLFSYNFKVCLNLITYRHRIKFNVFIICVQCITLLCFFSFLFFHLHLPACSPPHLWPNTHVGKTNQVVCSLITLSIYIICKCEFRVLYWLYLTTTKHSLLIGYSNTTWTNHKLW